MSPRAQGFMWGVAFGVVAMYLYNNRTSTAAAAR